MYVCFSNIDFFSFYYFSIRFWNCSDWWYFFVFQLVIINLLEVSMNRFVDICGIVNHQLFNLFSIIDINENQLCHTFRTKYNRKLIETERIIIQYHYVMFFILAQLQVRGLLYWPEAQLKPNTANQGPITKPIWKKHHVMIPLLINQSNIFRDFSLRLSKRLADSDLAVIGLTGIGPIRKISLLDWFCRIGPMKVFILY